MFRPEVPAIHQPLARYAHAIALDAPGRLLFVSGQLALARDGTIPDGAAAQAELIFANLDAILTAGGLVRADVLRISAFLVDRADLQPYMAARDRWIGAAPPPASTLLLVQGFARPEFKVEIEIVAGREATR